MSFLVFWLDNSESLDLLFVGYVLFFVFQSLGMKDHEVTLT